jgi:hypothetical protein
VNKQNNIIKLLKILEKLFKIQTGLQLAITALMSLLKIGTAATCLPNKGNFPVKN